ncbi:MAG TPA: thioredoxin-dependent thiol peroxidase [Flavobacteriales bacterium]|nr:thioredoxin-dependent thiol peroxidase [Flavobacteriales bacterium]|tara:strand:+ start:51173 stop:51628 length:456 start_codon:yes stop_codon:yes gene_type:complete
MKHLKIGDSAPEFKVKNQSDRMVELNQFKGKKLVIYFYPKDNTPGCTAQACNLRDNYTEFTDKGYEILGVSADSVAKHEKFIAKQNLPFDLLADEDKTMLNAYGVWGLKKFMGKEYDGIHRTTFVIDENQIITNIIEKVKTKEHAKQILDV